MQFKFDHLSFAYSKQLPNSLKDICFDIVSNQVTGLAGANGSGKTTLIRILLGQLINFKGNYFINEKPIVEQNGNIMADYSIGFAPETPVLDDALTGIEILSLVADIRNVSHEKFDREMDIFKRLLHIEEWLSEKRCGDCSTGMRKKIAIAIAFLGNPAFVVLDEPTNGLDPVSVFGLKKILALKKDQGIGSLIASHILDFVEKTADNVLLLTHGNMAYGGTLQGVFEQWRQKKTLEEIYMAMFDKPESGIMENQDQSNIQ